MYQILGVEIASNAEKCGARLVIESDDIYERRWTRTIEEAAEIRLAVGSSNIVMMADNLEQTQVAGQLECGVAERRWLRRWRTEEYEEVRAVPVASGWPPPRSNTSGTTPSLATGSVCSIATNAFRRRRPIP